MGGHLAGHSLLWNYDFTARTYFRTIADLGNSTVHVDDVGHVLLGIAVVTTSLLDIVLGILSLREGYRVGVHHLTVDLYRTIIGGDEDAVTFTFPMGQEPEENAAYTELAAAMLVKAKESKRVRATEHTPENSVKFLRMLVKVFPFKIQTVQTDNGTEFTYKYISDTEECPFDKALRSFGIQHVLIPPRTPWHNGKVERSHRNDQRYFYNWETFRSVQDLNQKLAVHLIWSNNKPMRTLRSKSPCELLKEKLAA